MIDLWPWMDLVKIDPNRAVRDAVQQNQDKITNLNEEQLDRGEKSDGTDTGQYSNIRYKGFLKPVNLKRTGTWRSKIQLDIQSTGFDIIDLDEKTVLLKKRYTDKILGLTPESENKAAIIIEPDVISNIERQLGI